MPVRGDLLKREKLKLSILNRAKLRLKSIQFSLQRQTIDFKLDPWYGRLGNNIQQILIAILHAEAFRGAVEISARQLEAHALDQFFSPLHFDFSDGQPIVATYRSSFFFFDGFAFATGNRVRLHCVTGFLLLQSLLSANHVRANLHRACRQYLRPYYIVNGDALSVDESVLVLHLRGGDIADLHSSEYATNPLCYYSFLRSFHSAVVLVVEPGAEHPLFGRIREIFPDCKVISGSIKGDFELLRQARFLASSGVGTFAVAAAMLSENLKRLYCSSAYLAEHLNPSMLNRNYVEVVEFQMKDYMDKWHHSTDRRELLLQYQPASPAYISSR